MTRSESPRNQQFAAALEIQQEAGRPLNGAAFKQLFESRTGLTLCLPLVVAEEAVAHFARQLEKLTADVHRLDRLLDRSAVTPVDAALEQAAYREHLLARFAGDGRRILPLPATSHEDLVRRATHRRRPFQEGGTGYRDALIWDAILAVALSSNEPVLLVSKNTRDFSVAPDRYDLHADLVADLKASGLPENTVRLVASIDDVLRDVVRPKLTSLDEMATALAEETFDAFSLREWIESELSAYVQGEELDLRETRRRYEALSVSIIETGHVDEFEVEDVYELPSHAIGIEFNASVETYLREDFDDDEEELERAWRYESGGLDRRFSSLTSSASDGRSTFTRSFASADA